MWEHADLLCLRLDSPEVLLGFLQHQSSLSFFSLTSRESSQWWEGYKHGPRHRRPESARWRAAASRTWETRMQWSGGSWWLWGCVLSVHLPQPLQLEDLLENRARSQKPLRAVPKWTWPLTLASHPERGRRTLGALENRTSRDVKDWWAQETFWGILLFIRGYISILLKVIFLVKEVLLVFPSFPPIPSWQKVYPEAASIFLSPARSTRVDWN